MGFNINNSRGAKVYRATDQTGIATATATAVSFSTAVRNPNSLWDSGAPTKFTVDKSGLYYFHGCVEWVADATGVRTLEVRVNGSATVVPIKVSQAAPAAGACFQAINGLIELVSGDYVELYVTHTKGSNTDLTATVAKTTPSMALALIIPSYDYSANSENV